MGIVIRQSLKQSAAAYIGVAMGMLNVLVVYPLAFTREELGVLQFLRETALMVAPFVFLGGNALAIRFFPQFRDEQRGHNGFLFFLLAMVATGFALFMGVWVSFRPQVWSWYTDEGQLVQQFLPLLPPLVLLAALAQMLTQYTANFHRIVVPYALNELSVKLVVPALALGYFAQKLAFEQVVWGVLWMHLLIVVGLVMYLWQLGQLHLRPSRRLLTWQRLRQMAEFASFGLLGGLGGRLASRIDIFMLTTLATPTATGVYYLSSVVGNVIDVPRQALSRISAPIISDAMNAGQREKVADMYRRTALNQLAAGVCILTGILLSLDDLFALIPNGEKYAAGKVVVWLLGLSNLINMATGINEEIITYSPYYRFKFYFITALAGFNVLANMWLIPQFEIAGAALATLLSVALYNLLKSGLLWWKMGLLPFSWRMLGLLALGGVLYLLLGWWQPDWPPLFRLMFRSVLFVCAFVPLMLLGRLAPDVNALLSDWWQARRHQ